MSWALLSQALSGAWDRSSGPPALGDLIVLCSILKLEVTSKISFEYSDQQKQKEIGYVRLESIRMHHTQ